MHSLEEEMDNETNLLKVVINAKKERNRMMQQKITEWGRDIYQNEKELGLWRSTPGRSKCKSPGLREILSCSGNDIKGHVSGAAWKKRKSGYFRSSPLPCPYPRFTVHSALCPRRLTSKDCLSDSLALWFLVEFSHWGPLVGDDWKRGEW